MPPRPSSSQSDGSGPARMSHSPMTTQGTHRRCRGKILLFALVSEFKICVIVRRVHFLVQSLALPVRFVFLHMGRCFPRQSDDKSRAFFRSHLSVRNLAPRLRVARKDDK